MLSFFIVYVVPKYVFVINTTPFNYNMNKHKTPTHYAYIFVYNLSFGAKVSERHILSQPDGQKHKTFSW